MNLSLSRPKVPVLKNESKEAENEYLLEIEKYNEVLEAYNKECKEFIDKFMSENKPKFETEKDLKDFAKKLVSEVTGENFTLAYSKCSYDENLKTDFVQFELEVGDEDNIYSSVNSRFVAKMDLNIEGNIAIDVFFRHEYIDFDEIGHSDFDYEDKKIADYCFKADENLIREAFTGFDKSKYIDRAFETKIRNMEEKVRNTKDFAEYINLDLKRLSLLKVNNRIENVLRNALFDIYNKTEFVFEKKDDQYVISEPVTFKRQLGDGTKGTQYQLKPICSFTAKDLSCEAKRLLDELEFDYTFEHADKYELYLYKEGKFISDISRILDDIVPIPGIGEENFAYEEALDKGIIDEDSFVFISVLLAERCCDVPHIDDVREELFYVDPNSHERVYNLNSCDDIDDIRENLLFTESYDENVYDLSDEDVHDRAIGDALWGGEAIFIASYDDNDNLVIKGYTTEKSKIRIDNEKLHLTSTERMMFEDKFGQELSKSFDREDI